MAEAQISERLKAERIQSKLKAERIQEKLKAERVQEKLEAERIQSRLAEVPGWTVSDDGTALTRTYDLPSLRAAGLFVELMLAIGEATGYVPEIDVRSLEVTLRIATSLDGGVTDLDFDVARVVDSRT